MHVHLGPATSQVPFPLSPTLGSVSAKGQSKPPSPLSGQPAHRLLGKLVPSPPRVLGQPLTGGRCPNPLGRWCGTGCTPLHTPGTRGRLEPEPATSGKMRAPHPRRALPGTSPHLKVFGRVLQRAHAVRPVLP